MVLLLLALIACKSDTGTDTDKSDDTGDTSDTGQVDDTGLGAVVDFETTADGVSGELTDPGTWVVVLFSADEQRGTKFGYGAEAGSAARVTPSDPMPDRVRTGPAPASVALGDKRDFRVYNGTSMVTVEGMAVRVTDELVVWKDQTTESPLGDIEDVTLDDVTATYEAIVLPRTRNVFATESDVDENGRIDVLVSYTVNQYGPVAYVSWCDIGEFTGCGTQGNDGEIVYTGIPDPESSYSSASAIVELWAHETNHLVYSYHKYMLNDQLDAEENIYLTEGMSELAQDLTGFNNGNQYIWASAIDMRDYYGDEDYSTQGVSLNDFLRGTGYYSATRDGPLRGGSYLFLRYLFEQAGGMTIAEDGTQTDAGGITFLHEWFDAPELGVDCVEALTGRAVEDVAFDWYTALLVTGRDINDDPVYNYQPRVQDPLTTFEYGVDTYANIHGWLELTGVPVQVYDEADGEIRAGGVEYLQFVVTQPGTISIPVDADALARARAVRVE